MASKSTAGSLIIDELLGEATERIKLASEEKLESLEASINAKVDGVEVGLRSRIAILESYTGDSPLVVNLGTLEKPKSKLVHKAFDTIIKILSSTKRKEKNIMLVGGAGGGKTYLVGSVAQALKLPFYPMSVGLQTTKSDLLGFINAQGGYMTSIVRQAYEHGGVLLLDEFDSAHAGVVTILNSLLANGHCSFPDGVITKHKDFVCLCACNTYGRGASIDYVGRNRLDGATLDRFIVVDVDYDDKLEKSLTNHKAWSTIVDNIRRNAEKSGVKVIISPRASMDGADLLEGGFSFEQTLDMVIFKGCDKDIQTKLMAGIDKTSFASAGKPVPKKPRSKSVSTADIVVDWNLKKYTMTSVVNKKLDKSITIYTKYSGVNSIELDAHNCFSVYCDGSSLYINANNSNNKIHKGNDDNGTKTEELLDYMEANPDKWTGSHSLEFNLTRPDGTTKSWRLGK
jgi:hypothetical protein